MEGTAGVRLVHLEAGEDKLSPKWDVWTEDGRRLEVRNRWGYLSVRRCPEAGEGKFFPSEDDPRRGLRVYTVKADDVLFERSLAELGLQSTVTTAAMLAATGMVLVAAEP